MLIFGKTQIGGLQVMHLFADDNRGDDEHDGYTKLKDDKSFTQRNDGKGIGRSAFQDLYRFERRKIKSRIKRQTDNPTASPTILINVYPLLDDRLRQASRQ